MPAGPIDNGVIIGYVGTGALSSGWSLVSAYVDKYLKSVFGETYFKAAAPNGNHGSTPDAAPLDITGDIELIVRFAPDIWDSGATQNILSKLSTSGDQKSYRLTLAGDGDLTLTTSTDGIDTVNHRQSGSPLHVIASLVNGDVCWIRVTLDVDDGASDTSATFYYSLDNTNDVDSVSWIQLGAIVKNGATTSIFSSSANVNVGARNDGSQEQCPGKYYRTQIISDPFGTPVVEFDPEFYLETSGTLQFTESSVNAATVTINQTGGGPIGEILANGHPLDPGTTGGNATHTHVVNGHVHTHSHQHAVGVTQPATSSANTGGFGGGDSFIGHIHDTPISDLLNPSSLGSTTPTIVAAVNQLNREELRFIQSDGTPDSIPIGGIVLFSSPTVPDDYVIRSELLGRYIRGSSETTPAQQTPGMTHLHLESATHVHALSAHQHTSDDSEVDAGQANRVVTQGTQQFMTQPHVHPLIYANDIVGASSNPSSSDLGEADFEPDFIDLIGLEREVFEGDDIEIGTIAIWSGTLASIPADWYLCDGAQQTPNALGRFARCAATVGELGATGGGIAHGHTMGDHQHEADHQHNVNPTGNFGAQQSFSGSSGSPQGDHHVGTFVSAGVFNDAPSSDESSLIDDNSDHQPEFIEVAFIRYDPTLAEVDPYGYIASHL